MIILKVLLPLPGLLYPAPEWIVWRGPANEGNYDHETTWKHDWLPAGPKTLRQTKVHTGYSGIAVIEGRAYTIGSSEGSKRGIPGTRPSFRTWQTHLKSPCPASRPPLCPRCRWHRNLSRPAITTKLEKHLPERFEHKAA